MYKNNKIGVVVPSYNEDKLIRETIVGIPKYVDNIVEDLLSKPGGGTKAESGIGIIVDLGGTVTIEAQALPIIVSDLVKKYDVHIANPPADIRQQLLDRKVPEERIISVESIVDRLAA